MAIYRKLDKRMKWMDMANKLIRDYKLLDKYYFIDNNDIIGHTISEVQAWYEKIKKYANNARVLLTDSEGNYTILHRDFMELKESIDFLKTDEGKKLIKPNKMYYLYTHGVLQRFVTRIDKSIIVEN